MFEQRLKHILIVFSLLLLVILWRLVDIQLVRAGSFRMEEERIMLRPAHTLPFVRGRILDRHGRVLASEEPCWQISVHYDALSGKAAADDPKNAELIKRMWRDLARFAGTPVEDLYQVADEIVARVQRWQDAVTRRVGYDMTIREQHEAHPIVTGLNDQIQIEARRQLSSYRWVQIEDATRREYASHPSFGHVLGQLGAVSAEVLEDDPHADDSLAAYLPTEQSGISGVEYAAESALRGRRGLFQKNRRDEVVENIRPRDGRDVTLTIDATLQEALYDLLADALNDPALDPAPPGGSIVVLHVPTRQVLAMVSCPGFDANTYREHYAELRDDTIDTPLRFRAVANAYAPGSIIKPLTCLAALASGTINTHTVFHCRGYYLENDPSRLRCWALGDSGVRVQHGDVTVEPAIAGSCNVFMYSIGDLLGPVGLTEYFGLAGLGKPTGVHLLEERSGVNPNAAWLMRHKGVRPGVGHGRQFAIGQGEVSVTPVQAANLMALYASGVQKEVRLFADEAPAEEFRFPVSAEQWGAIRRGLWRVTNDPHGTAYRTAHWSNGRYALCGKTGSATTTPRPTEYRVDFVDETGKRRSELVPGKVRRHAADRFRREHPGVAFDPVRDVHVASVYPAPKDAEDHSRHSHAWFAGYLQPITPVGFPVESVTPPIALGVLIEFGGSGGHVAGPIGKRAAEVICNVLGPGLDPNGLPEQVQ